MHFPSLARTTFNAATIPMKKETKAQKFSANHSSLNKSKLANFPAHFFRNFES